MLLFNAVKIRHYLEWNERSSRGANHSTVRQVLQLLAFPLLSTGDSGSTCAYCFYLSYSVSLLSSWPSPSSETKSNGDPAGKTTTTTQEKGCVLWQSHKRTCRHHHHHHTNSPTAGLLSPETTAPGGTKTNFKSSTPKANANLHSLYFPSAVRPRRSISRDLTCLQICTEGTVWDSLFEASSKASFNLFTAMISRDMKTTPHLSADIR